VLPRVYRNYGAAIEVSEPMFAAFSRNLCSHRHGSLLVNQGGRMVTCAVLYWCLITDCYEGLIHEHS